MFLVSIFLDYKQRNCFVVSTTTEKPTGQEMMLIQWNNANFESTVRAMPIQDPLTFGQLLLSSLALTASCSARVNCPILMRAADRLL